MTKYKFAIACAAIAVGAIAPISSAQAIMIYQRFNFTATNFYSPFDQNLIPPVSPVFASFSVRYDDAANYLNETQGLTLNSLNLTVNSATGFDYSSQYRNFVFGGLINDVSQASGYTYDYFIAFNNYVNNPMGGATVYYQGGVPFVSTTVSISVANVPEPASWALILSGFGLAGAALRRKKLALA